MVSLDGGQQESELQTRKFAGAFGERRGEGRNTASKRLATQLEELLGVSDAGLGFGPRGAAESDLLDFLTSEANRRTAVRGLGPASAQDIGQSIAPALIGFREAEAGRRQTRRGQDIQGLLELIGLAMPQIVAGQKSSGFSLEGGVSGKK